MSSRFSTDEELVQAVLARQPQALREFVRRFQPIFLRDVRAVARHQLDAATAEDLVQDFFLRLLRDDMSALRAWRPGAGRSLRTYLSWSTRLQTRSMLRSQRLRGRREVAPSSPAQEASASVAKGADPARQTEARQLVRRLMAALRPEEQRLLHVLFIDDAAAEEASAELGVSRMTLYKRKQRLLDRLRALALEASRPFLPAGLAEAA